MLGWKPEGVVTFLLPQDEGRDFQPGEDWLGSGSDPVDLAGLLTATFIDNLEREFPQFRQSADDSE
jgi:hypothetical protein